MLLPTLLATTLIANANALNIAVAPLPRLSIRPARPDLPARRAPVMSSDGAPRLAALYQLAGVGTAASWSLISWTALGSPRLATLPLVHSIALPLSLTWAVATSLSSAATVGWGRLQSATYRRLNLALAVVSAWLCAAVHYAPAFACGAQLLSAPLKTAATAAFGLTSLVSAGAWARSVPSLSPTSLAPRLVRGLVGSFWTLAPRRVVDDPDSSVGRDGRSEYALCAALFGWMAALPLLAAFPMASAPTLLGASLARPACGWSWLGAACCYVLRDAAERDRLSASTFVTLRRGLAVGTIAQLAAVGAQLVAGGGLLSTAGWQHYAALATYALAAFTACTPPPKSAGALGDGGVKKMGF